MFDQQYKLRSKVLMSWTHDLIKLELSFQINHMIAEFKFILFPILIDESIIILFRECLFCFSHFLLF